MSTQWWAGSASRTGSSSASSHVAIRRCRSSSSSRRRVRPRPTNPPRTSIGSCPTSSRTPPGSRPTRIGRSAGGTPPWWPSTRPMAGEVLAAFTREFCALGGTAERIWTPELGYGAPAPLLKQVPASVDGIVVLSAYGSYGSPVPFIRGYLARHPDAPRSLLLGLWMFPPLDTAPFASLWPDLRGVVARLSGVPNLSSPSDAAYRSAFAQAFPGPAAERREQSRRAAVLDCGGSPAAVAREDAWSDRRGACRLARGARLGEGSTRRRAACASTATARPSCR